MDKIDAKVFQAVAKGMTVVEADGATVADARGIPYSTKGDIPSSFGSVGSLMMADAANMYPKGCNGKKKNSFPTITLHSLDGSKTLIVKKYPETMAFSIPPQQQPQIPNKEYGQRLKVLPNGQIVVQCTPVMKRSQKTEKMYRVRCHSIH